MSELARIRRSLVKLSGKQDDDIDADGKLIGAGGESLLADILREADDTILERQLTLRLDTGKEFGLVLANRRLMRVYADVRAGLTAAANDALRQGISGDDREGLDALSQWFAGVIDQATTARIRTGDVDASGFGQMVGVTVTLLASEWNISLRAKRRHSDLPDPAQLIERFLAGAPVAKSAYVHAVKGEPIGAHGLTGESLSAAKSQIGPIAGPCLTAITLKDQNILTVYAVSGDHEVLVETSAADFAAISMSWDGLFSV